MPSPAIPDPVDGGTAVTETVAPAEPRKRAPTREPGSRIGRYVIQDRLGRGGMGVVYRAYDPELDRRIALKLMRVDGTRGAVHAERSRERMLREAQALAQLNHPNVVAAYDVGTVDGDVFVAMELVEGDHLRRWLKAGKRSLDELLAVMVAAGRGLAAAHAAGLVHRDVKPENILVGGDGRAWVADFGLARAADSAERAPAGGVPDDVVDSVDVSLDTPLSERRLGSRLTVAGAILGTPGYMSPEQYRGQEIDARSDQFSFCVCVWEAVCGERPFGTGAFEEVKQRVLAGALPAPPRSAGMPGWLRRALARGMDPDPQARHPGMQQLLAELGRDHRAWRRRALGGTAIAAAVAGAFLLARSAGGRPEPCGGADELLGDTWDEATRARVARRFAASPLPYAGAVRTAVDADLGRHLERWRSGYRDACEATRVHGDQSEAVMDLRMACLARRRDEVRALVAVLERADGDIVEHAVDAAERLPPIEACADLEVLQGGAPPADPAARATVDELRRDLAEVTALGDAGKYQEALERVVPIAERAARLDFLPIRAEALFRRGDLELQVADFDAAERTLAAAAWAADAGGQDEVLVDALMASVRLLQSGRERFDDARREAARADARVVRLGNPPRLRGQLELEIGMIDRAQGRYGDAARRGRAAIVDVDRSYGAASLSAAQARAFLGSLLIRQGELAEARKVLEQALAATEALVGAEHPQVVQFLHHLSEVAVEDNDFTRQEALLRRALPIRERALGPDHPSVGVLVANLAAALGSQKRHDESRALHERALRIFEAAYGTEHSNLATPLVNLGELEMAAKRYEQARGYFARALAIDEKALGRDHPMVAYDLAGLAGVELERGQAAAALHLLERAQRIVQGEPALEAGIRFRTGRALAALHRDHGRAITLAEQARAYFARTPAAFTTELAEIDAWLAAHRR